MKYLNLTEGFAPHVTHDRNTIHFEYSTFPGGEPHFRLEKTEDVLGDITITVRINSFNDLGRLMIAVDAIKRTIADYLVFGSFCDYTLNLFLPYMPGARQDRIVRYGEALTSKMYADVINNMKFDSVTILDPHSEVVVDFLKNVKVEDNTKYLDEALDVWRFELNGTTETFSIVLPDAGAAKKKDTFTLPKLANQPTNIYIGEKHRDTWTGNLSGFGVNCDDFKGEDLFIVDDICDGGGTFIGLGKELKKRNAGKLYLFITHGIFSKGFWEIDKIFDMVFTTDSFGTLQENGMYNIGHESINAYDTLIQIKLEL